MLSWYQENRKLSQSELNNTLKLMKSYKIVRKTPVAFELQGMTKVLQHPYENIERRFPEFEEGSEEQELINQLKLELNQDSKNQSSNLEINSLFPTDNGILYHLKFRCYPKCNQ